MLDKVPSVPLRTPIVNMTVGQFCRVLSGEMEGVLLRQRRALKALGQLKQLRAELKQMESLLRSLQTQPDADEAMAMGSVAIKPTAEETLLLEAAEAFGLDRLERRGKLKNPLHPAAEDVPLSELIVYKRREAASAQYRRAYHSIMQRKEARR